MSELVDEGEIVEEEVAQWEGLRVILLAVLSEGVLLLLYAGWAIWRKQPMVQTPQGADIVWGGVFGAALCGFNVASMYVLRRSEGFYQRHFSLVDEVMKPLADSLGLGGALLVSLCAGLGEELFFRIALQQELGLVLASLAFALLHFGTSARRYLLLVGVYFVFGLLFGLMQEYSGRIWIPIAAHAVYDFITLLYLKHRYQPCV